MADEFAKGFGIFTSAGLVWMVLASWYRTPAFESTQQLIAPLTTEMGAANLLNSIGILLMDVFFWFTIIGTLTFWGAIPALRQFREALSENEAE